MVGIAQTEILFRDAVKRHEQVRAAPLPLPDFLYARAQRLPVAGRYARFAACCVYASRAYRAASRLERSEGPFDVVEFAETNFEGLFWALKRKRYFIRSHTPWFLLDRFFSGEGRRSYSTAPIRRADEFFFRRATACSCPSGSLRQELMAEYGNGVPVEVRAAPS